MTDARDLGRREFLCAAATSAVAAQLDTTGAVTWPAAFNDSRLPRATTASNGFAFPALTQVDAGELNVGFVDMGPSDGPVVLLLHGWPYDIHSYVDVAPILVTEGYRVIVPHLRGHGSTRFLSSQTLRSGQQSAVALDMLALMDALEIRTAILGGYDWGARTANIMAALWPERCRAMVSVNGYLINNLERNKLPVAPQVEHGWWYQYYFATARGQAGYEAHRRAFARLIWQSVSPTWAFSDAEFNQSAASLDNPDHVSVVIHNYRWRLSLAAGAPQLDDLERKLAAGPVISIPTITLDGDTDGVAKATDGSAYASKFTGRRTHRIISGAGHNLPQEAPRAFADAIITVAGY